MAGARPSKAFNNGRRNSTVEVVEKSCGLTALTGEPAVESAIELMRERGIDITGHRAKQIDAKLVRWADLILVMEELHREVIQLQMPSSRGKVFRLGHFSDADIPDPYRRPMERFIDVLEMIEACAIHWVHETSRSEAATS